MDRNNSFPKFTDHNGNVLDIEKELNRIDKKMNGKIGIGSALALTGISATLIVGMLSFLNNKLVEKDLGTLRRDNQRLEQKLKDEQQRLKQELKDVEQELRKLNDRVLILEERAKVTK